MKATRVPLPKVPLSQLLSLLSLLLLLLLPRRSLTRSPPRCRGWRRAPSLAVRSRFRSFAGNPRGRRSHGYCRIRQGEATAPSRAHPRSPPVCPRYRHPRRTPPASAAMRAPRPKMSISSLALRPRCVPSSQTTHPPTPVAPRRAAPVRPTIRPPCMPLPSSSCPANPFQLHLDSLSLSLSFSPFSFVVIPRDDSVSLSLSHLSFASPRPSLTDSGVKLRSREPLSYCYIERSLITGNRSVTRKYFVVY